MEAMRERLWLAVLGAVVGLAACGHGPTLTPASAQSLALTSPAFAEGGTMPKELTCDGGDRSPALRWGAPPAGTASLALICDDPDAGGFVHWVLYDLPPSMRDLPQGVPAGGDGPQGARQGMNGFGKLGYGGPCPPLGRHRYVFRLFALDKALGLAAGATQAEVTAAMEEHILAEGTLMGRYGR